MPNKPNVIVRGGAADGQISYIASPPAADPGSLLQPETSPEPWTTS